jgi:uncharacterized membrane protein
MTEKVTRTIIVKADTERAFQAWANFENFPKFMEHIKSVRMLGPRTSHWKMDGPLGKTVEWNAETTTVDENKRIAWNTKDDEDSDVTTSGQVSFNSLPHGETEVTVTLQYKPQAGAAGNLVAKLLANPEKQLEEDLQNFKKYIEDTQERMN